MIKTTINLTIICFFGLCGCEQSISTDDSGKAEKGVLEGGAKAGFFGGDITFVCLEVDEDCQTKLSDNSSL